MALRRRVGVLSDWPVPGDVEGTGQCRVQQHHRGRERRRPPADLDGVRGRSGDGHLRIAVEDLDDALAVETDG